MKKERAKEITDETKLHQLHVIQKMVTDRICFNYTLVDGIKYAFWTLSFCKRCRSKKVREQFKEKALYQDKKYSKGNERLTSELDIVRFIFMMRNTEITRRVVFQKRDRDLIHLQRNTVISSADDSSGDEHRFNYTRNDPIRKIFGHKTDDEQEKFNKALWDTLKSYQGKTLNLKQKRIIEGIKSKTLARKDDLAYDIHLRELEAEVPNWISRPQVTATHSEKDSERT